MAARYRLTERVFIKPDDSLEASLYEAGAQIEYSGAPGRNMVALNAEAAAALDLVAPLNAMAENILPRRGGPAS